MKQLTPEKLVQRFKDAVLAEQALQIGLEEGYKITCFDKRIMDLKLERERLEKEIVQRLSERG